MSPLPTPIEKSTPPHSPTRRTVLKAAAIGLASPLYSLLPAKCLGANDRLRLASIGVGGKGAADLAGASVGHDVVAICDVDETRLGVAGEKYPRATRYTDWRALLEKEEIDALTISTPDHTHAPVTMTAMQRGVHVYTQKPLTHDVYEARQLTTVAKENRIVSQMGIQHHSSARLKNAVQIVRDGVIGKVSEVHTWTDRPGRFWKQGLERPDRVDHIPDTLNWDEWLGTAPERPYVASLYHAFHWRGWWDFGTGALGDMGCHILDPVVNALELGPPRTIEAEGPEPHPESGPLWCIVSYVFDGTPWTTDTLELKWYEAGELPPAELFQAPEDWPGSRNGVLFIGEKGNLFVGFPEPPQLFPVGDFADTPLPDHEENDHYTQWTSAIVGAGSTSCPFEYSGPLTETVLLGNVAFRSGRRIEWDSDNLLAIGDRDADALVRREYRQGWEVEGL